MTKSIVIIGAGMGGLSAGIYGQLNGFHTRVYEANYRPGGQCTSWKRGEYTFDTCIHHLMGCSPDLKMNRFWREIGALPTELVYTKECVSVMAPDGRVFYDYYDPDALEKHLLELSPQDRDVIREYVNGIRETAKYDLMGDMAMGNIPGMFAHLPAVIKNIKYFRINMKDFAMRFKDPFLQKAFPLLIYSNSTLPVFLHLMRHASGCHRDIAWPVGASTAFVEGIVDRYKALEGRLTCRKKVEKIITADGRAVGVRLEDGTEDFADYVISNADGRKTLLEMLEGKYMDDRLRSYCAEPDDLTEFALTVYLGVARDLSEEPSSMIMLLDQPVVIGGEEFTSLEMQSYGFDKTMAPEGKGVIKVEFRSSYSYWKKLSGNREEYEAEKQRVAEQVTGLLERRFPGIKDQVEAVDVSTILTWERFMGGTHGFANTPKKPISFVGGMFGSKDMHISGLDNFYFAGSWATSAGALFLNAMSGKNAIKKICKKERRKFDVSPDIYK
ncbi:MAG TPA: NAD(P)/FAD-dependent oxidoreductase [Anaerovoracaceae bacterium]|nr:NAD(P)/FAD-dependent oxidoreductase [Anaerovoracaceae bacterium]